jgi:hypothetical protein
MWLQDEETKKVFKTEFMMVQSCERRKDEMIYKNVSRNFISFDLKDRHQMALIGLSLKPFGFLENLHHKLIDSTRSFFRIWAETSLARKGEAHLRKLYKDHPEKFFDIHFANNQESAMSLCKCKFILSETTSQKVVSLQTEGFFNNEMDQIRKQLMAKESAMTEEQKLADEFSPEAVQKQNLISQS